MFCSDVNTTRVLREIGAVHTALNDILRENALAVREPPDDLLTVVADTNLPDFLKLQG